MNKKDIEIDWFSGTGKGGQHRNKHQNCCRIKHIETGLTAVGQECRERSGNMRLAISRLTAKIAQANEVKKERRTTSEVIRTYHEPRNTVLDKDSGFKQSYKEVVLDGDLSNMIEARKTAVSGEL
jgi:protein subunit release factor A